MPLIDGKYADQQVTLGQLVAALSPTIIFAALWNPFILVVFTSFAGGRCPVPSSTILQMVY
jgi:hypothetical protein